MFHMEIFIINEKAMESVEFFLELTVTTQRL